MKPRININQVLGVACLVLALLCFMSVYSPIRFDKERSKREAEVKERLINIRNAEEQYRKQHGTYTNAFRELIRSGLLSEEETLIPYSVDEHFELRTTTFVGKSGRQVPLMECGAQYQQYLDGLNENSVANLIEDANNAGLYPGLRIGDLTTPNNNAGNWE
ncbi:MAG: hypothetical protein J5610_04450 [Prevotella sp.]|nr:hypothetical protein [Prevotella sp.]